MVKKEHYFFSFLKLLRVQQWYKNLLVFAALFFSLNLFDIILVKTTVIAFVIMCIVSSAGYIINDIIDSKKDRFNPEKKNRPIASGRISKSFALILSLILYWFSLFAAYSMNREFFYILLILAVATFVYSIYFKNIVFADLMFIGTNFILRALAGVYIINVKLSFWFLAGILFGAFFLVAGKRYGDLLYLKKNAKKYKPVLEDYSKEILLFMLGVFLSLILIIYGLYGYFTGRETLLFLYPILIYILLRYVFMILNGHEATRNPEKIIWKAPDIPLLVATAIFAIGIFTVYYII